MYVAIQILSGNPQKQKNSEYSSEEETYETNDCFFHEKRWSGNGENEGN